MQTRTTWPALIGALIKGESLSSAEAEWAMNEIMEGAATPVQIAGFGVALRIKGTTVSELSGLARGMLDHATPIAVPGRIADLVGTGGDGAHTVNISTMGTIVAAAAGVRMVKHGNRAASSACGAADVLEALGVRIDLPPAASAQLAEEIGIAFLFAPLYHPALRHAATARRELGVPTVFNFLGPVANPARPQVQAVGVADPRMGEIIAGVLAERGCSALVFHGDDGLDELTTTTTSTVWIAGEAGVTQLVFDPAELGLRRADPADLRGGDAAHNAAAARSVLGDEDSPVRDTVLLNAAAVLASFDGIPNGEGLIPALREGYARAAEAVSSGAAARLLARWVETSRRLAAKD
ncbi:MAG TPA: anthranilate phosphoribosyltransferase [Streptosporangiaceae bacterium]|jgi:anthranilate phosphoribosyltransferase